MAKRGLSRWRRSAVGLVIVAAAGLSAGQAGAWGAYGHRLIAVAAVHALPPEVPAFLRTEEAVWMLGELAREPDRSKSSGLPHDADLDPGHFINVGDDGLISGGPALAALPNTRGGYETALREKGSDATRYGWLPYSIADGWQQLVKDFGYWRVDRLGAEKGATTEQRAWFARDLRLREALILRDLGYWSHFVGDACQPLHVSIHYNAWGDYPNPNHYTSERIHGPFEGAFVHANLREADLASAMPAPRSIDLPIMGETAAYIEASRRQAEPLFALWTEGGFAPEGSDKGRAFAAARLAAGASELRDLIVAAWRASPGSNVGYPMVKVADIESGKLPIPFEAMIGAD